jgi:hypothetical protein
VARKTLRSEIHRAVVKDSKEKVLPKRVLGKPILCSRCNKGGGTLVKDGKDGYRHENCPR